MTKLNFSLEKSYIECVINISEGRDISRLDQIVSIIHSSDDTILLHKDIGYDANRTVLTILGEVESVLSSIDKLIEYALLTFDIKKHEGSHPRVGILDVIPFIPVRNITKSQLIERISEYCTRIGKNYRLPILYYGALSHKAKQKTLHQLRKQSLEKTLGLNVISDCGPQAPHPKLGASCVTVRDFMVAYNINLHTSDLKLSKQLAKRLLYIRKNNGNETELDISSVKFLAWYIPAYNCCQISTNIYDISAVSMYELYVFVRAEAHKIGLNVDGSELIGMAPLRAITKEESEVNNALQTIRLDSVRPFNKDLQILDSFLK